ncbi:MAG: PilZ domain-containing protein [Nitrospirae bacterium]|nr:PilZ domain-containing protein [Nitrospirota bacterium]
MGNQRRSKRINHRLDAEVVLEKKSYWGSIENFSEVGIFKISVPDEEVVEFIPGAGVLVRFQLPSKEEINLHCSIKWLRITPEPLAGIIYNMGMEIHNPPPQYLNFVHSLYVLE